MTIIAFDLWAACQAFVGDVCRGRDASHGLGHMQTVTEKALLVYQLNQKAISSSQLARVILVGMLHDVNDHKYDKDGTLGAAVEEFVQKIVSAGGFGDTLGTTDLRDAASRVMLTISAISYSKEKKKGMRWFERELSEEWVLVRDAVSDADKLEAIGASGLQRSFEYNACLLRESGALEALLAQHQGDEEAVRRVIALDVEQHADEKLLRLKDEFIVTRAGKFLAQPRHDEMVQELAAWARRGPPPLPPHGGL
jgi:hypothetical protein